MRLYLDERNILRKESEFVKNEYSALSKLVLYNNLVLVKEQINELRDIYFLFFFDFRGRFYSRSPIGVSELKFSRYFFYYGQYSKSEMFEFKPHVLSQTINDYSEEIYSIKKKYLIKSNSPLINEGVF